MLKFQNPKNCFILKFEQCSLLFYHSITCPKEADRMANSVDPDQEQSDLGLHSLSSAVWMKT